MRHFWVTRRHWSYYAACELLTMRHCGIWVTMRRLSYYAAFQLQHGIWVTFCCCNKTYYTAFELQCGIWATMPRFSYYMAFELLCAVVTRVTMRHLSYNAAFELLCDIWVTMRHFCAVVTRVTIRHLWIKIWCIILHPLMESTFSKLSATVILHSATVKSYVSFAKWAL